MKKNICAALLLFTFLVMSGCASGPKITKLNGVWYDSQHPAVFVEKLMIIGIAKDNARRIKYETHMARALERRKIDTSTSSACIPDLKEFSPENIAKAIKASGAKSVLVSKVVGIDEEKVILKQTQQDTFRVTPYGTYMRTYIFDSPREETVKEVRMETGLFDVDTEKLLWAASSTIMNPSTVDEAIDDFSKAIVQQLTKDGYVRPGILP